MNIRKLETKDIDTVVELWYEVSVVAHDFISSDYWKENKEVIAKIYLPASETYLSVEGEKIVGFVAMVENYLAAIFVDNKMQGNGVGKKLMSFIKENRANIQLKVYKKNSKSVEFYKKQDFSIVSENKEEETGEYELLMEWNK